MGKKLILINGAPASGKTTLAHYLRTQLAIPIIEKDALKEFIFDSVGHRDSAWSLSIGKVSIEVAYRLAGELFTHCDEVVLENAFNKKFAAVDLEALTHESGCEVLEIYCRTDEVVRRRRFNERLETNRHPGHVDEPIEGEDARLGDYGSLGYSNRIDIDTGQLDVTEYGPDVVQRINKFLEG